MMLPVDKVLDPFCDAIQQMVSRGRAHPVRGRMWERFMSRGWPNKKSEPFTYVPLRQLYALDYRMAEPSSMDRHAVEQYILAECKNSVLIFIDGNFSEELSSLPASVTIVSLGDAEKGSYASFIQRRNHLIDGPARSFCFCPSASRAEGTDTMSFYIYDSPGCKLP
jgi:hypothetical protein